MKLSAEVRSDKGKNANNRLRVAGFVPAVVYSHGTSDMLQVNEREFNALFRGKISESTIIDLDVKGKDSCQVIIKDFQKNPITGKILHVDFYRVVAGEKISTVIPVVVVGNSEGVKMGGIFEQIEKELHVEVLPADLVEKIVVDITSLGIGEAVHVKDLKVPASMTFKAEPNHVVAHIVKPQGEAAAEGEAAK